MSEALHRDYSIGPELGRGRFGAVHRITSVSTGEPFAVKSINKLLISDPFDLACITDEPKLTLLASGGPHTVNLHAVYEDPASLHLVLDLCSGPDLLGLLSDRGPLSEAEAASLISFITQALACCHMRGLAHRDLKPENILFDNNTGRPKLSDFGSAGLFSTDKKMSGLVGTAHYVAPEVVRGEEYGERVDVWSAGVVMYVMLGGVYPFVGEDVGEVFSAVLRGNLRFPTRIFGGVSREAKDLMRKMMCRDPERRLSAEAVLRHPWIKSFENEL
ncbi:uncharacterized protein A4U43_UnF11210 [Asparagus officinalis]|uniref:Protein kinase domain-containing protein n=1 Tax=Asparagus officinalis TaxID=4686 RepID=A0A1R3L5B1_ASPOF|nr:phosphoenolpyruvate carboxylase kinase 1-like [Asparagus officinalis]ONK54798.1 uncharacterized protein A4U43_UnF11210 [Asparagus officinalis]